jgi:hypothetical protein
MGRASQRKKLQRRMQPAQPVFPFHLLSIRVKPYTGSGETCKMCRATASYAMEHYMDVRQLAMSERTQMARAEIFGRLRANMVTEQLAGQYIKACVTYHCEKCTHRMIKRTVGENTDAFMLTMHVFAPHLSILLGSKLKTQQDPGLPFATIVNAQLTVDELVRRLGALRHSEILPSVI